MKYVRLAITGLVLGVAITVGIQVARSQMAKTNIDSFEDCAAAGYPIQESFPERCVTPDGQSFTKQ